MCLALLYYCVNREVLCVYAYLVVIYSDLLFRQFFRLAFVIDVIDCRRYDAAEFFVLKIDQNCFFWLDVAAILIYKSDIHGLYYFDLVTRSIQDSLLYCSGFNRSDPDITVFRKSSFRRLDPDSDT